MERCFRQHPRPLGSCTRYARRAPIVTMVPHWSQLFVCGSWIPTSELRVSGGKGLSDTSGLTVEWWRWVAMLHTWSLLLCPAPWWKLQGRQLGQGSRRRHQPCAATLCVAIVREAGCAETRRHQQNDASGCTECTLCRKQGTRCGSDEAVLRKTDNLIFCCGSGWGL